MWDHGTNGPVMVLGKVRGDIYGGQPPLDSLVSGNLPFIHDFRSIYAEILSNWWGATNPEAILGQTFPFIGFL
jgi:uncharacterized protein (DUF1501 family)